MVKPLCSGPKAGVGILQPVSETPLLGAGGKGLLEQTEPSVLPKASSEAFPPWSFASAFCFLEAKCGY